MNDDLKIDKSKFKQIRKSKHWNIPLFNKSNQLYRFEMFTCDDELFVLVLKSIKNSDIIYQKIYKLQELYSEFSVLPKSVKDEFKNLSDWLVFFASVVNRKKIALYNKMNYLRIDFDDIAEAPKGAIYSVSINVPRVN